MYEQALETAEKLITFQRKVLALKVSQNNLEIERTELANYIYLKGQAWERCHRSMQENIEFQQEAIELEELNTQEIGKPKSDLLGRLYTVKAQMLIALGDNR